MMSIDRQEYLKRIHFAQSVKVDEHTLFQLHEHHVFHVPFENIDIHYKRTFDLTLENIFKKVVLNRRGGFCYELNALFNRLLLDIGFKSKIISSRILDDYDNVGPEYDHMSLYIEIEKKYLIDVGFGDLFIRPLEIKDGIQSDGRNLFKIEKLNDNDFLLSMSVDHINFQKKYLFRLEEVSIDNFHSICLDKQVNPASYFVKNIVCTKPTHHGRLTLLNNKLIEKRGQERLEKPINNDNQLRAELRNGFGIAIE